MKYFFRPECGREDRLGSIYGPFAGLQLTYNSLRETENGHFLAEMDDTGDWFVSGSIRQGEDLPWSDIVIWAEAAA